MITAIGTALSTEVSTYDFSAIGSSIQTALVDATSDAMKSAGATLGGKVLIGMEGINGDPSKGPLSDAMKGLVDGSQKKAQADARNKGWEFATWFTTGVGSGIRKNLVSGAMTTFVNNSVAGAIGSADTAGYNVGSAWAGGFARGVATHAVTINASFRTATAGGDGSSPPKVGPLKHIDEEGRNVGKAWSEGMADGVNDHKAFNRFASAAKRFTHVRRGLVSGMSNVGFTTESKKHVTVRLEVTSPDGTANRMKQADIRRGAMDALTVAGLEHYVTVG